MTPRQEQEHNLAALCHLCNVVPIWGLIFCGMVWFNSREKSRYLIEQTQQAMVFHGALMLAFIAVVVVQILSGIVAYVIPFVGTPLDFINHAITYILLLAYTVACLWGAVSCYQGKPFRYPFVGEAAE